MEMRDGKIKNNLMTLPVVGRVEGIIKELELRPSESKFQTALFHFPNTNLSVLNV